MAQGIDGLEGVVAAETVLSEVDGEAGRLLMRGRTLDEIAGRWPFEAVTALLWDGFFPDLPGDLAPRLGRARTAVFAEVSALDETLIDRTPVEAARALIARLADGDDLDLAVRLVAAPAVFTAAVIRRQSGQAPVAPDPALGHAADILRMTRGAPASSAEVDALNAYLVTVCDHGLNASTFAARVVASTRAGLTSAVLAGLSALKGPLHGGAPGPVIEMLDEIGSPENARAWLEGALDRGDRLMGFGHRVYRVRDPRADALKRAVATLAADSSAASEGGGPKARRQGASPWPRRSRPQPWRSFGSVSRAARCRPMWNSIRPCCSRPWPSRPPPSPACSPWAGPPAGSPTPANSSLAAAWCGRSRATSVRGPTWPPEQFHLQHAPRRLYAAAHG